MVSFAFKKNDAVVHNTFPKVCLQGRFIANWNGSSENQKALSDAGLVGLSEFHLALH